MGHDRKEDAMKHLTLTLSGLLASALCQGCSVYMAGSQHEKVDLASLEHEGMPRDNIIARLGPPTSSTKYEDGTRIDIYQFYEGSASGWKVGRAVFHGVADVFTLGLWEVVGTPTEMAVKGDKITARATFDRNDNLKEFKVLGREKAEKADKNASEEAKQSPSPPAF
jgi:outer membrane protein assembly factor BamE (lipoprotein component of BamABCDE complex)